MKFKLTLMLLLLSSFVLFAQNVVTVVDDDIQAGQQVNWTSDNEYLLDGLVFVESGAELTIQSGTVIKGKANPSTGDNTSALIIARDAKLYAAGTALEPIIFTAEIDDITDPNDLATTDRGLWGGVLILGNASINTATGVGQIEGIDPNEPRARYGGGANPDDNDDSGILRYVSIRHGGSEIGPGNEINGLTLGAVGDGTTIEYVEVFSNLDDGFEWFGGTVNTKYLVAAFCGDDGFDYDEGFRGKGQFWFAIQATDNAGRVAEQDGGTNPEDGQPYSTPYIVNATYIGPGVNAFPQGDGGECIIFRDNAGGKYFNTIFTEYNGGQGGAGITIEDLSSGEDSRKRLEEGDLIVRNNIWWQFGDGNTLSAIATQGFVADSLAANANSIANPQLASISHTNNASLDPRPSASGPAASGAINVGDPFFSNVNYYGAFDPNAALWTDGWTALWQDLVTGIKDNKIGNGDNLPQTFAIGQNYPNPFNPSTTIQYDVAQPSKIEITVYNVQGQKVVTLVDGFKQAGSYQIRWEAVDMPSGVYFYRFTAGQTVQTKRMILLK